MRATQTAAVFASLVTIAACGKPAPTPPPPPPPFNVSTCTTTLHSIATVPAQGCIISPARTFAMIMQPGGSLDVVALSPAGAPGAVVWTSGTKSAAPGSATAVVQDDGNLVVYDQGAATWNSRTSGARGIYQMSLTDKGSLVLRDAANSLIWNSGFDPDFCSVGLHGRSTLHMNNCVLSPKKSFVMVMQPSGALEIAPLSAGGTPGAAIWSSNSRGSQSGAAVGVLQEDGNLVVYEGGKPLWNSESPGAIGAYSLALSEDGMATITGPSGKTVWTAKKAPAAPAASAASDQAARP